MGDFVPAKRGMTAVLVRHEVTWTLVGGRTEGTRIEIGKVTSVSRDGIVRAVQFAWSDGPVRLDSLPRHWQVLVVPEVPGDEALRVAREHCWPGHPNQPMAFDSLDAVREVLAPLRKTLTK